MESFKKEESNESIYSSSSNNPNLNYSHNLNLDLNLDESSWLIEEEFFFFEGHNIIGNKWTFLSQLFPEKVPKQMKNHFYSSIVKTLRKVVRNKFDLNLKDIIVSYYSLIYIKQLLKNNENFFISKNEEEEKNKNVTLKKLIINNNINCETINKYQNKFEESVKKQIKKLYKLNIDISNLDLNYIFKIIAKTEILIKSFKCLNWKNLNKDDLLKIIDFIKNNYN
jgi:myb proto-oncogene protein